MIRLVDVSGLVATAAWLGLLPSLLAGLLVRQGEHGMATRIFAGLRSMLLLSAGSALIAVLSLIGGYTGTALRVLWATAFALALAAFVASLGTAVLRGGRSRAPSP